MKEIDEKIKALCEARGWMFKPWEIEPWKVHEDEICRADAPYFDQHVKAKKLRRQLVEQLRERGEI